MKILPLLRKMIEVKGNEKLSRADFEKKRQAKFTKLVKYVNAHSPLYAELIRDYRIDVDNCRPADFPIMTKSDVMDNFDRLVTCPDLTKAGVSEFLANSTDHRQLYLDKYHVIHTSGSSGEVGYFVFSEADWARACAQLFRAHELTLKKLKFAFFGVTAGHFAGISLATAGEKIGGRRNYHFTAYDVQAPLASVVNGLNATQPDYLIGYSSGLKLLAEQQIQGKLNLSLKYIYSGAEPLTLEDRQRLQAAFKAPVLNIYASTEFLTMGVGKADYQGLVLFEDDLIFELHRDSTCVTSLFNYTMPLIRYQMTDVLIPQSGASHLPPYMQIEEVVGRMEQAPVFTNQYGEEEFIAPSVVLGFYVRHLRRFQWQTTGESSFRFNVSLEKGISKSARTTAMRQIREKLTQILLHRDMANVTFEVQEVNDIPVDPKTGKFKLITKTGGEGEKN